MTKTSKSILKSGWAIFLGISAVISILLDVIQPKATSADGREFFIFGPGSATLGWLFVVLTMVVPALVIREVRKKPVSKWLAVIFVVMAWILWVVVHTIDSQHTGRPARFNYTIFGGLVLCWRFLRWSPDQTAPEGVPQNQKTFYFRRKGLDRIEGPGSLLHIRAHLMKHGGMKDVEIADNTGVPIEEIPASNWRPLL